MYVCNRCGTDWQFGFVCPKCGRQIGDPVGGVAHSRLERHLRTLATLWMAIGGLFLIPAVGLMTFGQSLHFMMHEQEPWPGLWQVLLITTSGTLLILAAGGMCVGLGLDAAGSLGANGGDRIGSVGVVSSVLWDSVWGCIRCGCCWGMRVRMSTGA